MFAYKNDWSLSEGAEELRYFSMLGEEMNLQGVQQELAPNFATLWFILFLGFIVNCCTGLEECLISHKQGFSPGSLVSGHLCMVLTSTEGTLPHSHIHFVGCTAATAGGQCQRPCRSTLHAGQGTSWHLLLRGRQQVLVATESRKLIYLCCTE